MSLRRKLALHIFRWLDCKEPILGNALDTLRRHFTAPASALTLVTVQDLTHLRVGEKSSYTVDLTTDGEYEAPRGVADMFNKFR